MTEKIRIHTKYKKRILLFGLAILLIVSAGVLTWMRASGFWDSSSAVHVKDEDIESSTLAIGTHLIYLGAMTDELYALAEESAEESSQQKIYYKSELADGAWYDITDAASLLDITTDGKLVSAQVIEELFFEYHTKSDGVTYDLRKNESVCVFDLKDPYDLWNLEELQPLRTQYSIYNEKDELTDADQINKDSCDQFWAVDVTSEQTKEYDQQLKDLQVYFEQLTDNDADPDMTAMVEKIMGKIDSARRALVFEQLHDEEINVLMLRLEGKKPKEEKEKTEETETEEGEGEEEGEEESLSKDFQVDSELVTSAINSQSNLGDSLITQQSNMLSDGDTLFSQVEYKLATELILQAQQKDYAACDQAVGKLIALSHIDEEIVIDPEAEVAILDDELIRRSEAAFLAGLSAGVTSDYATAKSNKFSAAVLNAYLKTQKTELSGKLTELEYYLNAKLERITDEQGKEMLNQRLEEIGTVYEVIVSDDFEESATLVVDDYKLWLMDTLSSLISGGTDSEMEALEADFDEAKLNYQNALDVGDLTAARKYKAELEAIQEKLDEAEERYINILTGDGSTDAQKAAAEAMLANDSAAKQIVELKKDAQDALKNDELTDLNTALDAIGALAAANPQMAKSALDDLTKEIATKMTGLDSGSEEGLKKQKELNDSLNKVAQIVADNSNSLFQDVTESDIVKKLLDGMDTSQLEGASVSDVKSFDELFKLLSGDGFDKQAVVAGTALARYLEEFKTDGTYDGRLSDLFDTLYNRNNPYVYLKPDRKSKVFAPTDHLAACLNYRYVFNLSQKKATLANDKAAVTYEFQAFSDTVTKLMGAETTKGTLNAPAKFRKVVYLDAEYLESEFDCTATYIMSTKYGVILTSQMSEEVTELLDYLISEE